MSKVDQFASVFRAADKAVFHLRPPQVDKILLVTDQEAAQLEALRYQLQQFLSVFAAAEIQAVAGAEYQDVRGLLQVVEAHQPDLIVTWRHLKSDAWQWPFSLGEYLDVLCQAAGSPVLVLPHPQAGGELAERVQDTDVVMGLTEHLQGDDTLVNWALRLIQPDGTLYLSHVESELQFERYMAVIAKIPEIDTELAREKIHAQLLKEPADFIASCGAVLQRAGHQVELRSIVSLGRRISEYKKMVEEHRIDLLVMHTKDESQAAMHGLAYPLAVELRDVPLLLL